MNAQSRVEPTSIVGVLAQALPALGAVHKNKKNPAFKSNYADLTAVLQALAPITEHGLWFRQEARRSENGVALETFYIHESGAELSAGITTVPVNKADAQGYGSAQTYCRRYALLTAFGLSADDDDGNAAAKSPHRQEAAKQAAHEELQQQLEQSVEQVKHDARKDPWGKFYSGKAALHKGLNAHAAELRRIGDEGVFDDLEAYLTSPEYVEFVQIAGEHAPHYLEGGPPAPEEFIGIFTLEQRARDLIALRGNQPAEKETA